AAFGLPMVVVLPLQWPEKIPLEGLPGLVGRLPGVRPAVTRWGVRRLDRSIRLVALRNRRAGRAVVPERRRARRPERLARAVAGWLDDEARRAHLRRALEGLGGEPGAAQRVAARVLTLAQAGLGTGESGGPDVQEVVS